jgi:hypothetical protein
MFLQAVATCCKRNLLDFVGPGQQATISGVKIGAGRYHGPGSHWETRTGGFADSARVVAAKPGKRFSESDFYSERLCGCHAKDAYSQREDTPGHIWQDR